MDENLNSREHLRWERRLITGALEGDREAFAELYRAHAPRVFSRVLIPKLGQRQAAEDALSETFRVGLERLHQFQPKKVSIYFWFARIASNKAMDMHRVKARTGRALANFEEMLGPLREAPLEPSMVRERAQDRARLARGVNETLGRLNPRYRRAIELRFMEERSRPDCAEALKVKIGTFDVLILRALKAFRREWDKVQSTAEMSA